MSATVQLVATVAAAFAAAVAAGATVWYALLTKRLWASTEANVALTKRMLERDAEPFCGISQLKNAFSDEGVVTVEFEVKNAGRTILQDVSLSSTWKGFDGASREQCTYGEEWIGVLLPGEATARKKYVKRVIRREAFASTLEGLSLHMAFCLHFQGPFSSNRFVHILLCSFDLHRKFYVRKSFIAREGDEWFNRQGHLLDDISSIIQRAVI
ncbi:MAG TPA: hypothetical protein VN428_23265 [Bryobacteraceae bacterium]|nr:hypothetical protein [Bryobacteraceae bacterium]